MEGRGILEHLHARQQGQEDAAGQAEGVEDREGIEQDPVGVDVDELRRLGDVGDEVFLGQDNRLGCAEAARGEEDDADVGRPGGVREAQGQGAGGGGEELVGQADLLAHVLEVGHRRHGLQGVDQVVELALLDELVGGEDPLDPGQFAGGLEVADARGEVEHGRHAAEGVEGEEGDHACRTRRQHDPDALALLGEGGDAAPEGEGGPDEVRVAEGITVLVLEDQFPGPEDRPGVHEGAENRTAAVDVIAQLRHRPLPLDSLSEGKVDGPPGIEKGGYSS